MNLDQLPNAQSPELVCGRQAWKDDYPWLARAFKEMGPGARAAADGWRVRIEDELKTTLDFKIRPDGTAVVWCGMSSHDFHHDPTPKELFAGLREAYLRELERVGGSHPTRAGRWKMSAAARTFPEPLARQTPPGRSKQQRTARVLPPAAEGSLTRRLGAAILPRVLQLTLIFVAVTALTLVLSDVAITGR